MAEDQIKTSIKTSFLDNIELFFFFLNTKPNLSDKRERCGSHKV